MAGRGRPPKPEGERHGHHKPGARLELLPPPPRPGLQVAPLAPRGLLKATVAVWASYWRSRVSQAADLDSDGYGLERWIRDVDEYNRVRRVLVRTRLVKGSTGQPVINPLASYLAELARRIEHAEVEFGMTPTSRAKLGLTIGEERLTVAKLNAMLNRGDWRTEQTPEDAPDALDGEWEEA